MAGFSTDEAKASIETLADLLSGEARDARWAATAATEWSALTTTTGSTVAGTIAAALLLHSVE